MLFGNSSEFSHMSGEGCFIVMVYEKIIKRRVAKPKTNRMIKAKENVRKTGKKRFVKE